MKRICVLLIAASITMASLAWGQNFSGAQDKEITIDPPQKSLDVGEVLEYSIEWLGVPIGEMFLRVEGIVTLGNRPCYHISGRTAPNKFFSHFYDAEYSLETFLDTETLQPVRFQKSRRVKNVSTYVSLEFDRQNRRAQYNYYTPQGTATVYNFFAKIHEKIANHSATIEIPADTQDVFSALYYFRTLLVNTGGTYPLTVCYGLKTWSLSINVQDPFRKEIRKRGTIPAFTALIASDLSSFILGKRQFSVIFSCDAKRLPLEFRLSTAVGAIRGALLNRS